MKYYVAFMCIYLRFFKKIVALLSGLCYSHKQGMDLTLKERGYAVRTTSGRNCSIIDERKKC